MSDLSSTLNGFFRSAKRPRRIPGRYVAIRGPIRASVAKDRNGLWSVTIDGTPYTNSLLRDLKSQLAGMGFDMLAEQPQ